MFDNNQYHKSVPDAFKKKDKDHIIFYVDEIQRYRSLKLEMPENSNSHLFSKCGLCYVNGGGMKVVAFIAIIRCVRRGSNFETHRPCSILLRAGFAFFTAMYASVTGYESKISVHSSLNGNSTVRQTRCFISLLNFNFLQIDVSHKIY